MRVVVYSQFEHQATTGMCVLITTVAEEEEILRSTVIYCMNGQDMYGGNYRQKGMASRMA